MADFLTPFAQAADKRYPTNTEKVNGFICGPADKELFDGLFHRIEAELGHLIAYGGLSGSDSDFQQVRKAVENLVSDGFQQQNQDLKNLVGNEMYFTATVDPNNTEPTEVRGGVFNSIADVVNAAPSGSFIRIGLSSDDTHVVDGAITLYNKSLYIEKSGTGVNPQLDFIAHNVAGYNRMNGIIPYGNSPIYIRNTSIFLDSVAPVPSDPWNVDRVMVRFLHGGVAQLGVRDCIVNGDGGHGLMTCAGGAQSKLSMFGVTLDGAIFGVKAVDSGVAIIASSGTTLSNGAALNETGTVGVNLLKN